MHSWNVVATIKGDGFDTAVAALNRWGRVESTTFYNVLVMRTADPQQFLTELNTKLASDPDLRHAIGYVVPVEQPFIFQNAEQFAERARAAIAHYLPQLAGKTFFVRVHRRGFRQQMSSNAEERLLGGYLLEQLAAAGTPARVTFKDPDFIVLVEIVGQQAGVALCARADRQRDAMLQLT